MIGRDIPITHDDIKALTQRSNIRALMMLGANWGLIAGAFAMAAIWPNPLTILAAILILGGRQLGLAVLMHECAHYSLFTSRRVNMFVGRWLCAWPVYMSYDAYRPYHLGHHAHAGTAKDPDLKLVQAYPITKDSLRRKLLRDLTGRTAFRDTLIMLKRATMKQRGLVIAFPIVLGAILWSVGALWTLALWYVAYFCIFPVLTRIRLIGEHGIAPNRLDKDARLNTATVRPNLIERLLIAPNNVSFHLEHHLVAMVPAYRLRSFHKMLNARGYFEGH
ncbi:MAG: fatty acid desaturase family protein, partial [Sphingomonadales bacterium]